MAIEVIHTCDRCKKIQLSRYENGGYPPLWNVAIICEPIDHVSQYHSPVKQQVAQWCRPCVDEMGVLMGLLRAESQLKLPSIEDIIRAIVQEEQQAV